jgi:hypothetical protein
MTVKAILDTDILSEYLKGHNTAVISHPVPETIQRAVSRLGEYREPQVSKLILQVRE